MKTSPHPYTGVLALPLTQHQLNTNLRLFESFINAVILPLFQSLLTEASLPLVAFSMGLAVVYSSFTDEEKESVTCCHMACARTMTTFVFFIGSHT